MSKVINFWVLQVTGERVLELRFADVRAVTQHKDVYLNPMSVHQSHQIIDFIQKWEGFDMVVNCAAGISRSGAIALFLHTNFGYNLKPNFWKMSEPNPFCYGTLVVEYFKLKVSSQMR